jgi:hypothetical protein
MKITKKTAIRISGMKRMTIDLDAALYKRLRVACVENEITVADSVRRMIGEFLKAK